MKVPETLHRLAEIDANAWIFGGGRPERIRNAVDRLAKTALLAGVSYLAYLVVTALLYAASHP